VYAPILEMTFRNRTNSFIFKENITIPCFLAQYLSRCFAKEISVSPS
jgi:hypothetical protein